MDKVKTWLNSQKTQYVRLWRVMKKPTIDELKLTAKVTLMGIAFLGAIGFVIGLAIGFLK